MGKQRHLNPQEINMQKLFEKAVETEVRRRVEAGFFDDKTRKAVRAANKVGIIMALTILLDAYEAEKENAIQFLDLYRELLKQYNNGDVQIKQLQKHIEVRTGVDINDYVEFNMDMVEIENKGDADEAETVCNA